jgi:hypothetical protein
LLLKDKTLAVFLIIITGLFAGCGNKKEVKPVTSETLNPNNSQQLLDFIKLNINKNIQRVFYSNFDPDADKEVAAAEEISNKEVWGIKFYFYKLGNKKLVPVFETQLLQGSLFKSANMPLKLNDFKYDFLYYNSQDYFLGTDGGEIFSYLIDVSQRQVYYAHLLVLPDKPVSLFLSKNITNNELKNFFISLFKTDYPGLKLITNDASLTN